jgi:hypothetical protein
MGHWQCKAVLHQARGISLLPIRASLGRGYPAQGSKIVAEAQVAIAFLCCRVRNQTPNDVDTTPKEAIEFIHINCFSIAELLPSNLMLQSRREEKR